ncbi:MAG TPA: hypothetical protein VK625_24570 [Flavitalea sp.]|nr:hypothetical protein [Flavitalea sp.]
MKKVFLAVTIMFTTASVTLAHTSADRRERKEERAERREMRRDENSTKVSYFTRNNFAKDFPDATNVRFVKAKDFEEVLFTSDKTNLIAYYDNETKLVGTTQRLAFTDLPENAQKEIHKKYSEYGVAEVVKFDDNEINDTDMILYGSAFDDADNYFVELKNDRKDIIVKINGYGYLTFFKDLK